jgi:hypothetical protein
MSWFNEFREEIAHDHRQIVDARARREGGPWVFDRAADAVRRFYRDRISGFAACGSLSSAERDDLLGLVEVLGRDDFPCR